MGLDLCLAVVLFIITFIYYLSFLNTDGFVEKPQIDQKIVKVMENIKSLMNKRQVTSLPQITTLKFKGANAGVTASGTAAPGAPASGTAAPRATASGTAAPRAPASGTAAPGAPTSGTAAPGATASGTAAPGAPASGTAAPGAPASGTAAPRTPTSGTAAPGATASGTTTNGAKGNVTLPKVTLPQGPLELADLDPNVYYTIRDSTNKFALNTLNQQVLGNKRPVVMLDVKSMNCNVVNKKCLFRFVSRGNGLYAIESGDGKGLVSVWNRHAKSVDNTYPVYAWTGQADSCNSESRTCLFKVVRNENGTVSFLTADGNNILRFKDYNVWSQVPRYYHVDQLEISAVDIGWQGNASCEFTVKMMALVSSPESQPEPEFNETQLTDNGDDDLVKPWNKYTYSKGQVVRKKVKF